MEKEVEALRRKVETSNCSFQNLHVDRRTLARYLTAHLTVEDAYQAMILTESWRREIRVSSISATTPGVRRTAATNLVTVLERRDHCGRPVVLVAARNHRWMGRDLDDLTQYMVYMLEIACDMCGDESSKDVPDNLCLLFDLRRFSLSCMDYPALRKLYNMMTDHYPERLGLCLVLNAPFIFSACWTIIRSWLDERTASKIKFVKSETLAEHLDPALVPWDV